MENKFRILRKEKGYSQKELAEILFLDQTTVSKWELNKAIPDYTTLKKLAELYRVSTDFLLDMKTTDALNIFETQKNSSPAPTTTPTANGNELLEEASNRYDATVREIGGFSLDYTGIIPLFASVQAGIPVEAQTDIIDYIPTTRRNPDEYFGIKVKGDSMRDVGIFDGGYVIVHKQSCADCGDIVIAIIDGEATVKRFKQINGTIWLLPENRDFSPIMITEEMQFEVLGVVVEASRRFK